MLIEKINATLREGVLRLLLQSSKMHGLHFLLLQKDSSRISADIFFDDKYIYIYIIVIRKIFLIF